MGFKTIKNLQSALKSANLAHTRESIRRWEKKGWLISPRSVTNSKRVQGKDYFVRQYTDQQIEEIVKAFSIDGIGSWKPEK